MVKHMVRQSIRRLGRSNQQGQSILLLAFGFIALAAFVGLVTDISIMFVRYASLRQAVDSAAIAAAGQIREGTNYGTVALSARQYIRLHGLDATRVWVETCETDIADWRVDNPEPKPLSQMPNTELCNWNDPRKLVRVRAQINSETTFLKLIGINDFILTAASVSETAALDVAMVLDTSMSMTRATTVADYQAVGLTDYNPDNPAPIGTATIRAECARVPVGIRWEGNPNYQYASCCNDPGRNTSLEQNPTTGEWIIFTDGNSNGKMDGGEAGIRNNEADGNYTDLICDPFKQVKDAARNFIQRLDFIRGDRVGLVTFDFTGHIIFPNGDEELPPMMNSEADVINTLDREIGVLANPSLSQYDCKWAAEARDAVTTLLTQEMSGDEQEQTLLDQDPPALRHMAYESVAPCTNTNIGDGLLQANNVLTNAETIRRDAVWIAILLTDGAANASGSNRTEGDLYTYGNAGFCPWATFCQPQEIRTFEEGIEADLIGKQVICDVDPATGERTAACDLISTRTDPPQEPIYEECVAVRSPNNPADPEWCNDNDPTTRHFCLTWSNDPNQALQPAGPECLETGNYDADDFAMDMADYAALIEVAPGIPGNFITIFTIGFGDEVASSVTAAPLLRYIADAGDNGTIDNNMQQDWRENKSFRRYTSGNYPGSYGEEDPCSGVTDPEESCGQYYFASDLQELDAVFETIASRLFTRISR